MKKAIFAAAIAAVMTSHAYASGCGDAVTCNLSDQTMGDTSSSADSSQSQATQSNPSSNSNSSASDIAINPSVQQSGNTVDQNGEQWSHSSSSSTGNQTDASSSSSSGGNTLGNTSDNRSGATGGSVDGSGNSDNRLTGGNVDSNNSNTATGGAGGHSEQGQDQSADASSEQSQSADNEVSVDASDRSTSSFSNKVDARSLYIPSIAAPVIPVSNPAAAVAVVTGNCGPLFTVRKEAAHGTYLGFFRTAFLEVGHDDHRVPYVDENGVEISYKAYQLPDGSWELRGHQPLYFTTVLNVSGSRHFGMAGGGGSAMNWAQGQGGGSAAMQRMITNIQAESCIAGRIHAPPVTTIKKIAQ